MHHRHPGRKAPKKKLPHKPSEKQELLLQTPKLINWAALVRVVHLERDLVVVEKPAGLSTVWHPAELEQARKQDLPPTLQGLLPGILRKLEGPGGLKGRLPPLRVVQRLDIGTSGLLVFARTLIAERSLGQQFRQHSVTRSYLAVVRGVLPGHRRLESHLVENRGDGLRGSHPRQGKQAITHVRPLEVLGDYTLVECRLETGRTHQIRIHLAEIGHPLCGERVYNRQPFQSVVPDPSGAPRVMLHAGELGFRHPRSHAALHFSMAPPQDFQDFLETLRKK